jgi:hypothetical protein
MSSEESDVRELILSGQFGERIVAAQMAPTPHQIEYVEGLMLEQPQAPCNVRHIFGPGLYVRELSMPAGTFAIGHYQKTAHLNVMLKGRVTVMNGDGTTTELSAPQVFIGQPGRKVGHVTEDMVWLNIYATDETDVDTLEATYFDKSQTFNGRQQRIDHEPDGDFEQMLSDLGVTAEQVAEQSRDEADLVPFPRDAYSVKVGRSEIHGRGLIATADIWPGDIICPVRIAGRRTPAGRYLNHAREPNARMIELGDDISLLAVRPIRGCRGGEDGEEVTVDYRDAIRVNHQSRITK